MIGQTYQRPLMGGRTETIAHPDSPGYTPEQRERDRSFRTAMVTLAAEILAHPWWEELPAGQKFDAQMALKHLDASEPDTESTAAS
ncbi:hypothetical protein [Streptomyces sp. NPDC051098]|uniref:hypothetical protein n=1 Tax=Streptomyces sp. NPDC051098 TaxID=3155411 RepID=UPI00343948AA